MWYLLVLLCIVLWLIVVIWLLGCLMTCIVGVYVAFTFRFVYCWLVTWRRCELWFGAGCLWVLWFAIARVTCYLLCLIRFGWVGLFSVDWFLLWVGCIRLWF